MYDVSIIPCKQYIKIECAPFGIKLYKLCSSSGLTLDFSVYCRTGMFGDDPNNENILFTDNFYTPPILAEFNSIQFSIQIIFSQIVTNNK